MNREESRIIYVAGPAYCPEERESLIRISEFLRAAGYGTYVPCLEGIEPLLHLPGGAALWGLSAALETYQIVERCDSLVFNMNGRVPDEGGVFKAALAHAAGKPLAIYKRDHRTTFFGRDNSMIVGLTRRFRTVKHVKKLPRELEAAFEQLAKDGGSPYHGDRVPAPVRQRIARGRAVWEYLVASGATTIEELVRLFGDT